MTLTVLAVDGIGEVTAGSDLARLVGAAVELADGDIVVVTSKVVSKAEGRVLEMPKAEAVAAETDRVVATVGETRIVRTRHGLVMAGAGVDASNTAPGTVVLLPLDPDASARALRDGLAGAAGVNVAVVVSDTCGRAWRNGQTDIAVGAAGLAPLHDYAGRVDDYGNTLSVTAPAVADEVAGAGDLVKGKLRGRPVAVVRGLADLVLPVGRHGPGAAQLVRDESGDLFGHGAREAVCRALLADPADRRGFGGSAPAEALAEALSRLLAHEGAVETPVEDPAGLSVDIRAADARAAGRLEAGLSAVAFAHGWLVEPGEPGPAEAVSLRFRPPAV